MATFSKVLLSGSTGGRGIKIAAIATPGTVIHSTGTSSSVLDEIWLYAYNAHTSSVLLTLEDGGVVVPDNNVKLTIPAQSGLTLVVPGLILSGSGSAVATVAAYADVTNVIMIYGYVNRIA